MAVVGTRATIELRPGSGTVALPADLAEAGVTVISGLARGIDAVAHRAALDAGGRTHCRARLVASTSSIRGRTGSWRPTWSSDGALISEYPLGTQPEASNFPPRNRIVSGLSRGVVVVEAGEQSGALITARFAADQGRDVFAVPGSIFASNSAGTNRLIRDGAIAGDARSTTSSRR